MLLHPECTPTKVLMKRYGTYVRKDCPKFNKNDFKYHFYCLPFIEIKSSKKNQEHREIIARYMKIMFYHFCVRITKTLPKIKITIFAHKFQKCYWFVNIDENSKSFLNHQNILFDHDTLFLGFATIYTDTSFYVLLSLGVVFHKYF